MRILPTPHRLKPGQNNPCSSVGCWDRGSQAEDRLHQDHTGWSSGRPVEIPARQGRGVSPGSPKGTGQVGQRLGKPEYRLVGHAECDWSLQPPVLVNIVEPRNHSSTPVMQL